LRLQWLDTNITGNCTISPVGGKSNALNNMINCYPNPSIDGIVNFGGNFKSNSIFQLLIYDITGNLMTQKEIVNGSTKAGSKD
jgi:hypothetical protein